MEKIRICSYCHTSFELRGANGGNKYCSDKCRNGIKAKRLVIKKEKMWKEGVVNGRPIKEAIYLRYQQGARKRKLPFELTQEQFNWFWQKPCTYCGDTIKYIGLDREDSSGGYHMSNVCSCCTECNLMKRKMPMEKFISHCKKIANKQRGRLKITG